MVAVIGDIHGCFYTLVDLFNKIREKYQRIQIYSVGDLVDRGKYSRQVFNFVLDENIKFTPGNHEFMFLHGVTQSQSWFAKNWLYNGEVETLESYRNNEEMVQKHVEAIKKAPLYYNLEDCFISHAGISEEYENEIDESDFWNSIHNIIYREYNSQKGVLWTRDKLLNIGKLQVVGHTRKTEVVLDEDSNALFIDTGSSQGRSLTAVVVHQNQVVDLISVNANPRDINI